MKRVVLFSLSLAGLALAGGPAHADATIFDRQMTPIVDQYVKIHAALAADETTGVSAAGKKIAQLSKGLDPKGIGGKHAKHYAALPRKIGAAATELAKAKDLAGARAAFRKLSQPLAMWATMSKPAGLYLLYCRMAKGSWLQRDTKVRNPYHGKSMLTCGEVVSPAKR